MKPFFTILCCLLFITTLQAQTTYNITNLRISGMSHNYDCGDLFDGDPEPVFRVRWKVLPSGSYGASTFINPGANTLSCGAYTGNIALSPASYSGSSNQLQFEIQAWEEDFCGDTDTYDTGFFCDDDDNPGFITPTITLASGITSHTFTLNNSGYTITISYSLSILPVSLTKFTGKPIKEGALLSWTTEQESNAFEYEIERSKNGRSFEMIGIADAAGDSNSTINYEFLDDQPIQSAFYRLKMVDFDGAFEYSPVISLKQKPKNKLAIEKLYPNPTNNELNVGLHLKENAPVLMRITNMIGNTVKQQTMDGQKGLFDYTLDVSNLPSGQYILTIINKGDLVSSRFVVN